MVWSVPPQHVSQLTDFLTDSSTFEPQSNMPRERGDFHDHPIIWYLFTKFCFTLRCKQDAAPLGAGLLHYIASSACIDRTNGSHAAAASGHHMHNSDLSYKISFNAMKCDIGSKIEYR